MEMVLSNGFCEMTQDEVMDIEAGGFWDDLARGFGNAFGLENVTASEVVEATGRTIGDFYKAIWGWLS
ncbi:MAG: hypothetical protein ACI4E1_00695 [Lachnospira sp.]